MNHSRYLIALDLDGTLLTDDKTISPFTIEVIKEVIEKGHIVVIATGRPRRASIQYYQLLQLSTPMINYNGALICHPKNNSWETLHEPISRDVTFNVLDACYTTHVQNILAEVQDHVYLDQHDEEIIDLFQLNKDFKAPLTVGKLLDRLETDPTALLVRPDIDHLDVLITELDDYVDVIAHRQWADPFPVIEIMKKGIHKAYGIQKLAKHFDIPKERIIAFGDENNDLEMIDYVGIGVAMENGNPELKKIADHVTDTNENDGVAKLLKQLIG